MNDDAKEYVDARIVESVRRAMPACACEDGRVNMADVLVFVHADLGGVVPIARLFPVVVKAFDTNDSVNRELHGKR